MKPTISVIMPIYNRADVLTATLDSILAQTYQDFELIGVDDGSIDNAPTIFREYAARDQRLQLFTKTHTNAGDARNLGYDHSHGDYLIFLDSDDLLEPDFLATMLSTLQQNNSDIVICNADEFDHQTGAVTRVRGFRHVNFTEPVTTLPPSDLMPHLFDVTHPAPWNKILKRSVIEQHHLRFQSLTSNNDLFFILAYLIYAQRITFIDCILIHHRVNDHRSLSAPENFNVDKFNRCLALDHLRQQLPPAIFQPWEPTYYAFYFQKALDGINRSTFAQGQRIFAHTRQILTDHMDAPFPQLKPRQRQFLISLQNNDFAGLYQWLRDNNQLRVTDPAHGAAQWKFYFLPRTWLAAVHNG